MKHLLAFKTVAVDTLAFQAGTMINAGESFKLYGDYCELNDDDVTNQGEEQIIRWILSSSGKGLLLQELGVERDAFVALSVRQPIIPPGQFKPGDIDLIVCGDHRAAKLSGSNASA